jgi:hypothetical protein
MAHTPPVPPDQRSPGPNAAAGHDPNTEGANAGSDAGIGRRDETTGLQSSQPGDDDVNLKQQGRQGNTNQNTHHQGYQQDR